MNNESYNRRAYSLLGITVFTAIGISLEGCAPTPTYVSPARVYSSPAPVYDRAPPPEASPMDHIYEVVVKGVDDRPIPGASVSFEVTPKGGSQQKIDCVTGDDGTCRAVVTVPRDPTLKYVVSYSSDSNFKVDKEGYYGMSGRDYSLFGSSSDVRGSRVATKTVTLLKPVDYLAPDFSNASNDQALKERTLRFLSLLRLQSIIVDADVVPKGIRLASFKDKKYFQLKINTTNVYNSLKMDKYGIGRRLFDDSVTKILNPLNDHVSDPKAFYGYDLIVYGYTKSFAEKYASAEKIEYRFLIPQDLVRKFKDKDISGQQMLNSSVILMNDERVELKLQ